MRRPGVEQVTDTLSRAADEWLDIPHESHIQGAAPDPYEHSARAVLALFESETVTTAAELDALPVGSVVAWFWPDHSGPTVHWHDADDGWTNGDTRHIRHTDPLDAATVLYRGGDHG